VVTGAQTPADLPPKTMATANSDPDAINVPTDDDQDRLDPDVRERIEQDGTHDYAGVDQLPTEDI